MKTMLFNPYTGTPRHPSDIASDPEGILIMDPEATTLEAAQPTCNQSLQVARPERKPAMDKEHQDAIVDAAQASPWSFRRNVRWVIEATERHHGILPAPEDK